jgi:glycine/D-amino acid oxidase-like deaminating enzyme
MWTAPDKMRALLRKTAALFFGDAVAADIEFENYRVCWDLSSRDEHFVIGPVGGDAAGGTAGAVEGLFMATAGSFHGYKFLPVIGKYVAQMLEGTLDERLARKWAWGSDRGSEWRPFADAGEVGGVVAPEVDV